MCILLGCDYCDSIKGIGPKRAIELIKKHKSLEKILENLDSGKYVVPEDWIFQEARKLFINPDVCDASNVEVKKRNYNLHYSNFSFTLKFIIYYFLLVKME